MPVIELVKMIDMVDPSLRAVLLGILEEMERQQRENVTKREFNELKEVVRDLGHSVNDLAEAQKRTEQLIEELAEAQNRTERRVEELAEAQKRTEHLIEELAEAQNRTERRVEELAVAQTKTEKEIAKIYQQIGGLSNAVGYGIEDDLMPHMDAYAEKVFGVHVLNVDRTNIEYADGRYDEINILAPATDKNGQQVYIVAECKAQPGKKDIDRFVALLTRVSSKLGENLIPLFIGYSFMPEVERYAASKYPQIKLVKTYQIKMAGRRNP
jgi:prefoldin subunit 5